ncbi:ABC transporter permease [Rhodanobacter ginsengisoli]|uniref:Transport permease protein n=1 Tax=Rhodanobacter ginsengisoli TaxID=418646 RepID=A0ABW0QTV3_9GAMM
MECDAFMNPHDNRPATPISAATSIWKNRELIVQMTRREVVGRYKGSTLGLLWSFLNPMLLLFVYTFVFSVVFKARWGTDIGETKTKFAIILFVGMIVHGLFAEVINRSPELILGNANFVKKIIFPLEILPVITLASALFHAMVSTAVLLIFLLVINGHLSLTAMYIPLVILPLVMLTLGLSWIFASLGVFIRDIGQITSIITMVMMFLAPVFYPITALPENIRPIIMANPLTFIIVQARDVLVWGRAPNWVGLATYALVSVVIASLGYFWFQKTRKGFADVI